MVVEVRTVPVPVPFVPEIPPEWLERPADIPRLPEPGQDMFIEDMRRFIPQAGAFIGRLLADRANVLERLAKAEADLENGGGQ